MKKRKYVRKECKVASRYSSNKILELLFKGVWSFTIVSV